MTNKIIPAFYINITEKCNMKCEYCPTYGENWESSEGLIDMESLLNAIEVAKNNGIQSFRISGGEPMIFPDRVFSVISKLNELGIEDIVLNSNGFNLYKYALELRNYKIKKVKISIDTLDKQKFKEITNLDKLEVVLKTIFSLKENNIPQELNMVVFKKNSKDFWDILDFCVEHDISIKLLDLVYYDILVRNDMTPLEYWKQEYYDLSLLTKRLEERFGKAQIVRLSNDRGIPMSHYKISQTATLTIKDGQLGSTYADVCKGCKHFPCQEGLFHLSLSAEGNLTPCRLRRDLTIPIQRLPTNELENHFKESILAYQNPFFVDETVNFPV